MKKLMIAMLGLSLLVGTTSMFGADDKDTTKSTAKGKKKGGKKKSTEKKPDKS